MVKGDPDVPLKSIFEVALNKLEDITFFEAVLAPDSFAEEIDCEIIVFFLDSGIDGIVTHDEMDNSVLVGAFPGVEAYIFVDPDPRVGVVADFGRCALSGILNFDGLFEDVVAVFDVLLDVPVYLRLTEKLVEIVDDDESAVLVLLEVDQFLDVVDLELGLAVQLSDDHDNHLAVSNDEVLDELLGRQRFECQILELSLEVLPLI